MLGRLRLVCGLLVLFMWLGGAPALQAVDDNATPQSSPPSAAQGNPSLSISETVYDFGEVDEGEEVAHGFVVRNNGQEPLEIHQVRPG